MSTRAVKKISFFLFLSGTLILSSCQKVKKSPSEQIGYSNLIKLEKRIFKIEQKLENSDKESSKTTVPNIPTTIKSITFRIGSEDDRLRVYWSDGTKTDLPCTKDKNIWACG